jgi:site-specific DNA-methyltransferase (adenine-specific)
MLDTELVAITDIHSDTSNARKHSDKNIRAIAASLDSFGQRRPLVVWNNMVIAGNGTLQAAISLGWKDIVITRVPDDWTDKNARAYALADNKTAELAEWDQTLLVEQLIDLDMDGFDLSEYGFAPLDSADATLDADTTPQLGETKYAVIIDCDSEWQQSEFLERFKADGLAVRPLML